MKQRRFKNKNSKGNWIQTYTGKHFFPLKPRKKDVRIEDIAHSLSNLCRYNGHTNNFYSVAKHSVLLSYLAEDYGGMAELQMLYLLHDAHEAYIGDMTTPMKYNLRILGLYKAYKKMVEKIDKIILKKFGVNNYKNKNLELDHRIVINEKILFMGFLDDEEENPPKNINDKKLYLNNRCKELLKRNNEEIEDIFLARFYDLRKRIKDDNELFKSFKI